MPGSKNSRSRPRRGNCRGRGGGRVNSTSSNENYRSQHTGVGNRGRGDNRERDNSRGSYSAKVSKEDNRSQHKGVSNRGRGNNREKANSGGSYSAKVSKEDDSTTLTDASEDYEHATPGVLNVSNLQEKKHDWEFYKTSLELFHCHRMLRDCKEKENNELSTNQSSSSEYSDDDCIKEQSLFKQSGKHVRSVLPNSHHKKKHCYRSKMKEDVPPNEFINLSIFPSRQDIINESPFLRSNIVKGEYKNCKHYLDVQFRLFREDYISPLREGIKEYKERIKECKERFLGMYDFSDVIKRLKSIYIYEEVKVTNCELDNMFGLIHTLCFKPLPPTYSWNGNSRLQAGTLLCLSLDEFVDNFIFATVAYRTDEVASGKIKVCFEEWQHDILFDIPASKTYIMLEMRSAYFESYRHTLSVLKEFNEDNFPLKQYIVKAKKEVEAPCYLDECTLYDFSPVLKKETFEDEKLKNDLLELPVLNLEKWPSHEELGLDFTQYNVLKAALTKEFCIIQGPPGTGKTFMGLKIVKMLLHNMNVWYPHNIDYECPILIVCYTNHALDQFLEKILEFTKKVVRVGEQSQSEILELYTLLNLRSQANNIASDFYHDRKRLQKKQNDIKDQISSYNFVIEAAASVIFKPKILKKYIQDHYPRLVSFYCNKPGVNSVLEKWLEVPSDDDCNQNVDCTVDNCDKEDDDMSIEEICSWVKWELCDDKKQSSYGWNKPAYKMHKEYIKKNMSDINMMTAEEVATVENILDLEVSERWRLYRFWIAEFITFYTNIIKQLEKEFVNITKELRNTRWGKDLAIVRHANIVGVTCTGTAKYHGLIEALSPQIVVIEEAAEVLEAHLISSLPKSTKHLILIGDHQQLRPLPSVHELAVQCKLDVSLFERMVKNEVEYSTLVSQHRMRPCIANLLVDSIYNELSHHESVYHYDDIIGIERNMHFISHVTTETKLESSYYNLFEAKMVVRLSRYFLLQGYEASQITVLATYSGQVRTIRNEANQISNENKNVEIMMKDVMVTTVDNYQGEENDIIIVSFVRSNFEGSVGFLKAPNRVCVALSRARKGLYCFGNFEFLASESELWKNIVTKLKKEEAISSSLTLICQNHSFRTVIEYSSDFKNVFDGGCKQICGAVLKCEHICQRFCHSTDTEHRQYKCEEKCRNRCKNGHPCEKKCHEPCGNCTKNKFAILPNCGHRLPVPCYVEDFSKYKCEESCSSMLRCGHACTKQCYESCEPCMRKVPKTLTCKHTVVIECSVENIKCTQQCRYVFPCDHRCPNRCGENCPEICKSNVVIQLPCNHVITIPCIKRNEKIVCKASCNQTLSCGHNCPGNCTNCLQGEKHVECWYTCNKIVNGGRTCKLRCGHSNKCNVNVAAKKMSLPDFGNKSESSKSQRSDRHLVNKWKTGYDDDNWA